MSAIKIAIIGSKLMRWGGGIDFLIDFIKIFETHQDKYTFEVFLLEKNWLERSARKILKKSISDKRIRECLQRECPKIPIVVCKERSLNGNDRYASVKEIALSRCVDILMPMDLLMNGINDDRYLTVSYIYDLQHKHMPELFKKKELSKRDRYFRRMLSCYDFAFTQSYDTKNDLIKNYGEIANDVYVMYAYPHKIDTIDNTDLDIYSKYGIDLPFFMVCNQFWIHKNHRVVFDALEILYDKGIKDVMVVCTGDTNDYRDPRYFSNIKKHIDMLRCRDNIKILGYIDKEDQVCLLKHSISLIQPTLFEGNPGGGSVVDAMAYGVPCIVSDIPVNLEIPKCFRVDTTVFFEKEDASSLALCMEQAIAHHHPEKRYKNELDYAGFYTEYDKTISDMVKRKKKKVGFDK